MKSNERNVQELRRPRPFVLATGTPGQSWKNIVLQSSQTSADCWTNSMWHLLLMQKAKKAHPQHTNLRPLSFSDKHIWKVHRTGEQAHCSLSHWGLRRNTEVRGLQTFPSLLRPRGVLRYFHFTNNLRTIVQDAGSGGATERASLQNRETHISRSLAKDQVYIWASDPWQEAKSEKLLVGWITENGNVMLHGGWAVAVQ